MITKRPDGELEETTHPSAKAAVEAMDEMCTKAATTGMYPELAKPPKVTEEEAREELEALRKELHGAT